MRSNILIENDKNNISKEEIKLIICTLGIRDGSRSGYPTVGLRPGLYKA